MFMPYDDLGFSDSVNKIGLMKRIETAGKAVEAIKTSVEKLP